MQIFFNFFVIFGIYGRYTMFEGLSVASHCEISSSILQECLFIQRLIILLTKGMGYPLPKRISLIKFISAFIYESEQIFREELQLQ